MDLITVLCVIVAALAAALYCCYKTNKPLRKKAKEEAAKALKAKQEEETLGREKHRRLNQRHEVFNDLEEALRDPHRLMPGHVKYGQGGPRFKELGEFILKVNNLKCQADSIDRLHERLAKQAIMLRDNEKAMQEIQKALQLGQPIERV